MASGRDSPSSKDLQLYVLTDAVGIRPVFLSAIARAPGLAGARAHEPPSLDGPLALHVDEP